MWNRTGGPALLLVTLMSSGCAAMADFDGDGFPASDDCDDTRADVHAGADEVRDSVDQDCDGGVDEDTVDGGNTPTVTLTWESGEYYSEYLGGDYLGAKVWIDAVDIDGDLGGGTYEVWLDAAADGALGADAYGFGASDIELREDVDTGTWGDTEAANDECAGAAWIVGVGFIVGGHDTSPNTTYEFAVTVADSHGHQGPLQFVSGSTCREDGSPGDGTGP